MKQCEVKKFSKSYSYFLKQFYKSTTKYPKIKNVNLPISFFRNDMKRIATMIKSNEEVKFWKTV